LLNEWLCPNEMVVHHVSDCDERNFIVSLALAANPLHAIVNVKHDVDIDGVELLCCGYYHVVWEGAAVSHKSYILLHRMAL